MTEQVFETSNYHDYTCDMYSNSRCYIHQGKSISPKSIHLTDQKNKVHHNSYLFLPHRHSKKSLSLHVC